MKMPDGQDSPAPPAAARTGITPLRIALLSYRFTRSAAVIASPEYVHAPSGVTKNALDWLAGSTGLYGKPVLLMSASPGQTGGLRGLAGLIAPLLALDALLVDPISVSKAPVRIRPDGTVTDVGLDLRLEIAVEQLADAMSAATGHRVSARV